MGGTGGARSLVQTRLDGLIEVSHVLSRARSLDDVVRPTARVAQRALEATSVSISRFEPDLGVLRTLVNAGELAPWEEPLPEREVYRVVEYPSLRDVARGRGGRIVRLGDPDTHDGDAGLLRQLARDSALLVPVVTEGRVWGELFATRTAELPPFVDADLAYADAVAAHIAAGIAQTTHLERIEQLAYTDQLTGLANRRALDLGLDAAMTRFLLDGTPVAVLLCDVNGLKRVNDSAGHAAGDRLLVAVAALLSATSARLPHGLAARLGGDEFCVFAEGARLDAVVAAGRALCAGAVRLEGADGVAVGIASTDAGLGRVATAKQLLRLADAAQYRAKRSGARHPVLAGHRDQDPAQALLAPPSWTGQEPVVRDDGAAQEDPASRRRTFRRSDLDVGVVLAAATDALDDQGGASLLSRLQVVAEAVCRQVDGRGWRVSHTGRDGGAPVVISSVHRPGAGDLGGAAAAGVATASGDWLVEVCTDEQSVRVDDLVPALRGLVALAAVPALHRAAEGAPGRPAHG